MHSLLLDLRLSLRMLAKHPGFTAITVLTLAIGIAASTALFSVVNAFLLRPLQVQKSDELVTVSIRNEQVSFPLRFSYPLFEDLRANTNDVLSDVIAYVPTAANFALNSGAESPERIWVEQVSANFFSALGVQPIFGRGFLPEEDRGPGAHPVIVLSHAFWKNRFDASVSAVGSFVHLNGRTFTVVGVAPESFKGPEMIEVQGYVPIMMWDQMMPRYRGALTSRGNRTFNVIGRLQPGATVKQAAGSLEQFAQTLEQDRSDGKPIAFLVLPENRSRPAPMASHFVSRAAAGLLVLAGLVLAICCFNVANLLIARTLERSKETAVRAALGATRWQIARVHFLESLLISSAGGILGWQAAFGLMSLLKKVALPTDIPIVLDWTPDIRVAVFCAAVVVMVALACGGAQAAQTGVGDLAERLKGIGSETPVTRRSARVRHGLITLQICVALMLLVAALMFIRSVQVSRQADLGFNPKNLLLLSVEPDLQNYEAVRTRQFYQQLLAQTRAIPGVTSASLANYVPLDMRAEGDGMSSSSSEPKSSSEWLFAFRNVVEQDYFRAMGVPIVRGRAFDASDHAASKKVVIVNETAAEKLWPGQDAIGKLIWTSSGPNASQAEIVGVSKNGRYLMLGEAPRAYIYFNLEQDLQPLVTLHVRTAVEPHSLVPVLRGIVAGLDPQMPVFDVKTGEELLNDGVAFGLPTLAARCVGLMGLVALALAAAGTYGVVSFAVAQRTREIGVRMALGATPGNVVRLVLKQGVNSVLLGLGLGLAGALATGRLLQGLLYGVSASDPWTLIAIVGILAFTAAVACFLPARRATRVNPIVALRYE